MRIPEIQKTAARDNAVLCTAMWRAHGLSIDRFSGCVGCVGVPPRFYPTVVTVDPHADHLEQVTAIADRATHVSGDFVVKDSYRILALDRLGFEPLFEAQWVHRPASLAAEAPRLAWRPVTSAEAAGAWERAWSGGSDEPPLFLPAFVSSPGVTMLAGWDNGLIRAGCIVTASGGVAGVSNVFGKPSEVVNAVAGAFPGRDLVGYERGDALAAALESGFQAVGGLVVWRRP